MKKRSVRTLCILVLLIAVVIFGITIISTKKISLIADSTCAFPCWNNVKLGETNKAGLLKILTNVSSVDQGSIFSQKRSNYGFDEVVVFDANVDLTKYIFGNNAEAWLINDKVVELLFQGDSGITLMQAIQKLGAPDHVYADFQIEITAIDIEIFFKEKGVIVGFSLKSPEADIVPDQKLDLIGLVDPNLYQKILESGEFTHGKLKDTKFILWNGYGKIKDKYWVQP